MGHGPRGQQGGALAASCRAIGARAPRTRFTLGRKPENFWSRRQESNLYPTLRRHVHYPLCYGESARFLDESGSGL